MNTKLKDVIAKAKQNNVPNDNIERMLKKASGDNGGADYEEIIYEGYYRAALRLLWKHLRTTGTALRRR